MLVAVVLLTVRVLHRGDIDIIPPIAARATHTESDVASGSAHAPAHDGRHTYMTWTHVTAGRDPERPDSLTPMGRLVPWGQHAAQRL